MIVTYVHVLSVFDTKLGLPVLNLSACLRVTFSDCEDLSRDIPLSHGHPPNKALQGVVMTSKHVVISELHCLDLCLRMPRCEAYNFQYNKESKDTRECELLYDSRGTPGHKNGFTYQVINRKQIKKVNGL